MKSRSVQLAVERQQFTWTAELGVVQRSRAVHSSQSRDSNSLGQLSEESCSKVAQHTVERQQLTCTLSEESCSEVAQHTAHSRETAIHLDS